MIALFGELWDNLLAGALLLGAFGLWLRAEMRHLAAGRAASIAELSARLASVERRLAQRDRGLRSDRGDA
jgi:hypothetical protein